MLEEHQVPVINFQVWYHPDCSRDGDALTREKKYLTAGIVLASMMLAMMVSLRPKWSHQVGPAFVNGIMEVISVILLVAFAAGFYFTPTIVAVAKKSKRAAALAALNLLLGWTLIGWVVALVWAIAEKEPVVDPLKAQCPCCLNVINYGARICQFCHARFTLDQGRSGD